jgi:hypothetical protein
VGRFFGQKAAAEWNTNPPRIAIPIALQEEIPLPAVTGSVNVPAANVPFGLRVSAVTPYAHRFIISIALLPDSAAGDSVPGLAGAPESWTKPPGMILAKETFEKLPVAIGPEGLLTGPRVKALSDTVNALAGRDSLWRTIAAREQDMVIALPRPVINELLRRVVARYRTEGIRLDLKDEVEEKIEEDLRVKAVVAKVGVGHISIHLLINRLQARLRVVDDPKMAFRPPLSMQVDLPVRGDQGRGIARLNAKWDPAAVVSVACRGFEIHETLEGTVQPIELPVRAWVDFALENGRIVGRPRVRRDKMHLSVQLTDASWKRVRAVFDEARQVR